MVTEDPIMRAAVDHMKLLLLVRSYQVWPSFRALSGRLKFTVRHHKFDKDSLCLRPRSSVHLPSRERECCSEWLNWEGVVSGGGQFGQGVGLKIADCSTVVQRIF